MASPPLNPSGTAPNAGAKPPKQADSGPKKGGFGKIIAVIVAVAVIAIGIFAFTHIGNASGGSSTASISSNGSAQDQTAAGSDAAPAVESGTDSNYRDLRGDVNISKIELKNDESGRYYITGTITNSSTNEYAVKCDFSAIQHQTDKYGEDVTDQTTSFNLESPTPGVVGDGNSIRVWNLQPSEKRDFVLYPSWSGTDDAYSDLEATVNEVTLHSQVADHLGKVMAADGDFEVSNLNYDQKGRVTGSITNNTGLYLDSATVYFVMEESNGELAASQTSGTRPAGVEINHAEVRAIKPGDTVEFETNAGQGYAKADLLHVFYHPDAYKQSSTDTSSTSSGSDS